MLVKGWHGGQTHPAPMPSFGVPGRGMTAPKMVATCSWGRERADSDAVRRTAARIGTRTGQACVQGHPCVQTDGIVRGA